MLSRLACLLGNTPGASTLRLLGTALAMRHIGRSFGQPREPTRLLPSSVRRVHLPHARPTSPARQLRGLAHDQQAPNVIGQDDARAVRVRSFVGQMSHNSRAHRPAASSMALVSVARIPKYNVMTHPWHLSLVQALGLTLVRGFAPIPLGAQILLIG